MSGTFSDLKKYGDERVQRRQKTWGEIEGVVEKLLNQINEQVFDSQKYISAGSTPHRDIKDRVVKPYTCLRGYDAFEGEIWVCVDPNNDTKLSVLALKWLGNTFFTDRTSCESSEELLTNALRKAVKFIV